MERNIEIIDKLHSYVWAKENEIVIKEYFSGINNMNGALIVIQRVDNNKLSLAGYAREGWINQHTAGKAI